MIGVEGACFQFFCQLLQVSSTLHATSGKPGAAVCDSTTHAVLVPPASPCLPHSCSSRRDPHDPPKPHSCPLQKKRLPRVLLQQFPPLCSALGAAPGLWDKGVHAQLPQTAPQAPSSTSQATELTRWWPGSHGGAFSP